MDGQSLPCVPPVVNLGNDTSICTGAAITLDAGNTGASFLWSNNVTTQTLNVNAPGTYYVTASMGSCSTSDTIVIGEILLPVVDLGNDTAICSGTSFTLDAGNAGSNFLWSNNATAQTISINQAGIYYVAVTNSGGCSASDTVAIGESPLPSAVGIIVRGTEPNFNFSADGAQNADTYTWDFGDGHTGAGADVAHNYEANGNYNVILTLTNDCGSTIVTGSVAVTSVGIFTRKLHESDIAVYPNPATNVLSIRNQGNLPVTSVKFYNILGQEVALFQLNDQEQNTVDISVLSPGLYTIVIQLEKGTVVEKVNIIK